MKSILYDKSHLSKESTDEIIKELKEKGYKKVRKVDKIQENGKTFYRIRIYEEATQ